MVTLTSCKARHAELADELKHIRGGSENTQSSVVERTQPTFRSPGPYPFKDDARNILALCDGSNSRGFITQVPKVLLHLFIIPRDTDPLCG